MPALPSILGLLALRLWLAARRDSKRRAFVRAIVRDPSVKARVPTLSNTFPFGSNRLNTINEKVSMIAGMILILLPATHCKRYIIAVITASVMSPLARRIATMASNEAKSKCL